MSSVVMRGRYHFHRGHASGQSPELSANKNLLTKTCKQKLANRQRIRKGKNGTRNISNIAIEAPQWRCLILMFVNDFVELNFSDRNFLNLRPSPNTNLAFHRVCPEALTIPPKTANRQKSGKPRGRKELKNFKQNGGGTADVPPPRVCS
jgi:hypothetical protein